MHEMGLFVDVDNFVINVDTIIVAFSHQLCYH